MKDERNLLVRPQLEASRFNHPLSWFKFNLIVRPPQMDGPSNILYLLAPGAGAPSSHPSLLRWEDQLKTIGKVCRLDYPYMLEGRRRPDRLPALIKAHRAALEDARKSHIGPIVLIGKSMGGRVGCHLALEEEVTGVVCLSYPLCGGGDRTKLRDKVLFELSTPVLFIQGTRDPLCPLDLLGEVRAGMHAVNELHLVQGGDHSLQVTKSQLKASGETQEAVEKRVLQAIREFTFRQVARKS